MNEDEYSFKIELSDTTEQWLCENYSINDETLVLYNARHVGAKRNSDYILMPIRTVIFINLIREETGDDDS